VGVVGGGGVSGWWDTCSESINHRNYLTTPSHSETKHKCRKREQINRGEGLTSNRHVINVWSVHLQIGCKDFKLSDKIKGSNDTLKGTVTNTFEIKMLEANLLSTYVSVPQNENLYRNTHPEMKFFGINFTKIRVFVPSTVLF
jgi:hypothetical protein